MRRIGEEQIKQQLIDSLGFNENIDKEELNMRADRVNDCQEALNIMKECEDIIKTNRKKLYQQGKVLRKFKENRKFKNLAEKFKITKGTIIFKINIVKLIYKISKNDDIINNIEVFKKLLQKHKEYLQGKP